MTIRYIIQLSHHNPISQRTGQYCRIMGGGGRIMGNNCSNISSGYVNAHFFNLFSNMLHTAFIRLDTKGTSEDVQSTMTLYVISIQ